MKPAIDRDQWLGMVDAAVECVLDAAAGEPRSSPEHDALCHESSHLRQLREEVLRNPPGKRPTLTSPLIHLYARVSLRVPQPVIETVGKVYDTYRRWANRREWESS